MCGIAGYIYLDGRPLSRERDERILIEMGNAIHHRGPDDTQVMLWENVGFVFKRLSIVDLDGGRQPFETHDGRVSAMINGEIYNHQAIRTSLAQHYSLATQSDCEVIPYLYVDRDLALFEPVNGMFAVALLDRRKKRVLLARDRLGIKPLFYCVADGGKVLVFASELKGLFAHPSVPRRFDWSSALAREMIRDTRSCELASYFHGIERIPAAGILDLALSNGTFRVDTYWQLPTDRPDDPVEPASFYVDGYRELLEQSVRLRLMADVEYGVFLSGGIDSAAVAAIAAKVKQFPTFSVMSQSTIGNGDAEASYRMAKHLDLPNHQVFFDHRDVKITPDDWREILWSCELFDITAEQLFKFYLHAFAKKRYPGLKVILIGQGSDEFSGGYMDWTTGKKGPWKAEHWRLVGETLRAHETRRAATETGLLGGYEDLIERGVLDRSFVYRAANRVLNRDVWDLYTSFYRQNLDFHLWHEDRTSSAHAIETRVPFVDHRLLTFMAGIPVQRHAELFSDKKILRLAVADLVPENIAARPKGYFFYGRDQRYTFRMMLSILKANDGELIDQALAASERTDGPLNPTGLKTLLAEVEEDPAYRNLTRLLGLVNMGVLADLADRHVTVPARKAELPVCEVMSEEHKAWVAEDQPEALDNMVIAVPRGYTLAEVKQSAQGGLERGAWYIFMDGKLSAKIKSPALAKFLLHVDGKKTLSQIVEDNGLNRTRVRKYVRQALEQNILVAGFQDRE